MRLGDLISRSEAEKLGATCLARRNENGQLEAIISLDNAPTVELDESVIQEVLNKRCMTAVANEYLVALHDKRPQSEYTEEDIKEAIKENFDLGYEMAKNKYKRPRGEWKISQTMDCHSDIINIYTCPFCGKKEYADYPFCHCGADMRKGGEEE